MNGMGDTATCLPPIIEIRELERAINDHFAHMNYGYITYKLYLYVSS
jgi:hypothetical protein